MRSPPNVVAEAMGPLQGLWERNNEVVQLGPAARSQAAVDSRTALGSFAWHLALPANAIALDHLVAWRVLRLAAGVQPSFAHLTLIRVAIEGAAVARWLLDPALGSDERLRRAAGVQLADYEQRLRYERRMGPKLAKPTGRAKTAAQRIEALDRLLRRGHLKPIAMPSATDLFARYALPEAGQLGGEALYRLISSLAHAKQWAILSLVALGEQIDDEHGPRAFQVTAHPELAAGATAVAMHIVTAAVEDIERYAGRGLTAGVPVD
jgi:hypothetical protein